MAGSTYEPLPWTDAWWDALSDADLHLMREQYATQGDTWHMRQIDVELDHREYVAQLRERQRRLDAARRGGRHGTTH